MSVLFADKRSILMYTPTPSFCPRGITRQDEKKSNHINNNKKKCLSGSNRDSSACQKKNPGQTSPKESIVQRKGKTTKQPQLTSRTLEKDSKYSDKFKCHICGLRCKDRWHYTNHQNIHLSLFPYKCQKCKQTFRRKNYKESHEDECIRGLKNRYYPCNICGKRAAEKFRKVNIMLCNKHGKGQKRVKGSHIACRCFDDLERLLKKKIEHIHFKENLVDTEGEEHSCIPGKPLMTCDGYDKENGIYYEFLGNEFHGWPPSEYPQNKTESSANYFMKRYGDLFKRTMAKLNLILCHGYTVHVIWEHDWVKAKTDAEKLGCIREFKCS